ncbi:MULTISPECIES: beta-glucoside-specific PTS transporter subunit IIABC [Clostridium]|uniref:beta-glucoside-specific PTS transporter subunit IIABC n=1 Tax=Clostridium TaxID=1485 RepID=UPI001EEEA3B6|nr:MULTISPECIES: beta-glucoside-specific PTS transporter subunit IIABC [Clostridium]
MAKYDELVDFIIENIGGKANVESLTHCMTRLRFSLKDFSLINEEELKKNQGIVTAQKAGGKYQVVIGTHVGEVYEVAVGKLGIKNSDKDMEDDDKTALDKLIDTITKVMTPGLGALASSGLIQGLLAILTTIGVLSPTDGAYIILHAMGNAIFAFFPIILGYTSAKAFKSNVFTGMLIGSVLVFTNITTNLASGDVLYNLFTGTIFETAVYKTFFGIPIMFPATGYGSTVIPIIFAVYFASKVEKVIKGKIPDIVGFTLVPFLTLLISAPAAILIIGPIANFASLIITAAITWLYELSPIITTLVVALIYQPLVILGLHWPLITIAALNFAASSSDYILPMLFTASFAQTAVVLAVYIRTKNKKTKAICVPAIISGCFCIIEPAIYGITLPVKKRFAFSMIGAAIGSIIISIFSIKMYAMTVGVLGIVGFLNPNGDTFGLVIGIIGTLVTMIIAFLLTYFTFSEEGIDSYSKKEVSNKVTENIAVKSPMKGRITSLENAEDPIFSQGTLGKGVLIYPEEGKVIAPCNGIVTTLFPTGHAIGITSDSGEEILIHIGRDTVQLEGKYFYKKIEQGSRIKEGDLILEFDIKEIEKAGYITETPIIISNSTMYLDILESTKENVDFLDTLLTILHNKVVL